KIFPWSLPGSVSIGTSRKILDSFVRPRTPDSAYQIMTELSRASPCNLKGPARRSGRTEANPSPNQQQFAERKLAQKIVRPLESIAETQPQLQPALLRLSGIVSQCFTRFDSRLLTNRHVVIFSLLRRGYSSAGRASRSQ